MALTFITVTDIIITVTVIIEGRTPLRDHVKGGALTEVTFFILLSLYQPRHGYAIMQFVEDETEGRLVLGAGTLYGALTSLLEKGWIALCESGDARKKEYRITPLGEDIAVRELQRLYQLVAAAKAITDKRTKDVQSAADKQQDERLHELSIGKECKE